MRFEHRFHAKDVGSWVGCISICGISRVALWPQRGMMRLMNYEAFHTSFGSCQRWSEAVAGILRPPISVAAALSDPNAASFPQLPCPIKVLSRASDTCNTLCNGSKKLEVPVTGMHTLGSPNKARFTEAHTNTLEAKRPCTEHLLE